MEEMYAASCICTCAEKTTKPIVEWGEELHLDWCTRPEPTQPYGRLPLMEDNPWWKTTFDGRRQWGQPQKQRGLAHCWKGHSAGHIPPALRYFWGSLHFLCCLHILYHLHFWVGIILSSSNLFGFLGYFHIWGHTEGFWAQKKGLRFSLFVPSEVV